MKDSTVLSSMYANMKSIEVGHLYVLKRASNVIPKPYRIVKTEKYEAFRVTTRLIWIANATDVLD